MRNKILDILYTNEGCPVSGQELSHMLGVSRTAVWKHVKTLVSEGYRITGSGGKGYTLFESDLLNEYELNRKLNSKIPFLFKKSVGSTNTWAKEEALKSDADFMLVTAENQESGRGRLGRGFESDNKKGAWCSFIMKPDLKPEKALIITIASAIAVCKTLKQTCGLDTGIKWPNDIISNGKKICGILSEMSCETNAIEYIVVGIGINVLQDKEDFSRAIREMAASVYTETGRKYRRSDIIAALCYNMQEVYSHVKACKTDEIINSWKEFSVTDGKRIRITTDGVEKAAFAEGIDGQGRLIIRNDDGEIAVYNSGEISVRGIMGYI
jgi:BirA family biotin operon repressor/biotin-[acetyl-CoA-carboxylase] ligase